MAITVTMSPYVGVLPLYGVQARAEFVARAEYSWSWITANTIAELGLFKTQANALETNVNAKEVSATASASTATAQALIATQQAAIAVGAVGSLPSGTINDAITTATDTWSSSKINTAKQATLVSGTNIKTVNGTSVLGTGDISITSLGSGGASSTVPLTLTSASASQQSLTATAFNQAVTLPDATTLSLGVTVFGIYNDSKFTIGIKDAGGNLLGFISPFKHVICSLADKSTANGKWNLSGEALVDIIGQTDIGIGVASTSVDYVKSILIDTNKYLILCSVNSATLVGVVYDAVNGVFGTPTTIRVVNVQAYVNAIQVSAGVALVVSCTNSSTAFSSAVVTVTGTTMSVGTETPLTLGGNITATSYGESITLTKVGTSYIAGWYRATTTAEIVAMTVSGTTVTIGTVQAQIGTGVTPVVYDMGSNVAMVLSQAGGTPIYATPVTVSGVTLTGGTQVAITTNITGFSCRKLDSGRIAIVYLNTNLLGAIISLSGTTATASIVQLGTKALASVNKFNIQKVGNQVIVACGSSTANLNTVNILTDNAGTAVAGTDYGASLTVSSTSGMYFLGSSATALYVLLHTLNSTDLPILKVSISGNDPVVETLGKIRNSSTTALAYNYPASGQGLYDGHIFGKEYINGSVFKTFIGSANITGIFGLKNDSIITSNRPLYIKSASTTGASNPSDDVLIIADISSRTNSIQLQVVKAV